MPTDWKEFLSSLLIVTSWQLLLITLYTFVWFIILPGWGWIPLLFCVSLFLMLRYFSKKLSSN